MKRTLITLLVGVLAFAGLAAAQPAKQKPKPKKTTICHATGSKTHPYVKLTVKAKDLAGHQRHPNDIVPAPAGGCPSQAVSPAQGGTELKATLSGANEIPGPGDPDGTGTASIRLQSGLGRLCFTLKAEKITLPASAAHIHVGTAGQAGDVVVPLKAPDATGTSTGCTNVSRTLVGQILANPAGYYVNVHTSDFPNGAIRGQLAA